MEGRGKQQRRATYMALAAIMRALSLVAGLGIPRMICSEAAESASEMIPKVSWRTRMANSGRGGIVGSCMVEREDQRVGRSNVKVGW